MKKIERERESIAIAIDCNAFFIFSSFFSASLSSSSSKVHAPFTRGDGRNAHARGRRGQYKCRYDEASIVVSIAEKIGDFRRRVHAREKKTFDCM